MAPVVATVAPKIPMTEVPWVPRKRGVSAGDHIGCDPALPVGRPCERDQGPFAGDEILDFDRVADGENIRVARAHVFVDADPAALADLEPGRLCQRGLRTHADGEDHDVCRVRLAGFRENLQRAARALLEAGHRVTEREADAVLFQVALDEACAFRIERSHDLIEHLDDRHFESAMDQVFRHLKADVSAADHHRALRLLQRLESRGRVLLGQIT